MIIDKQLIVSNKKRAAIVAELRSLDFRPFPKVKKAIEEGEVDLALEEEEEGSDSDYDYLLGMAIWSLTAEKARPAGNAADAKVEKLLAERNTKEEELIELLKLTPQGIWNTDLDNFLVEWEVSGYAESADISGCSRRTILLRRLLSPRLKPLRKRLRRRSARPMAKIPTSQTSTNLPRPHPEQRLLSNRKLR
jgi:DNA topoisomerase-2